MKAKGKFKNVGVLMGGDSTEKEISLKSGEAVCEALECKGYNIKRLTIKTLYDVENLLSKVEIDCIFIALHGGFGEDGAIQKILDDMEIPYTGSSPQTCYLAMNKIESKKILEENGLSVPAYKILKLNQNLMDLGDFSLPLVVKPSMQGSSIGLTIVYNKNILKEAIKEAFNFNSQIIIEQYIEGKEITVGILENEALPVIEIVPKREFYDYKAKYTKGLTEYLIPAPINRELCSKIQNIGLKAHKSLNCDYFSRIDMRLSPEGEVFILEINSIPGLTPGSLLPKAAEAAGVRFEDLCAKIVNSASCKQLTSHKSQVTSLKLET